MVVDCKGGGLVPRTAKTGEPPRRSPKQSKWLRLNLLPDVAFSKQTRQVTSPVAASPAQALLEEFGVIFQRGLDLAVWVILHVGLVTMVDHPSS